MFCTQKFRCTKNFHFKWGPEPTFAPMLPTPIWQIVLDFVPDFVCSLAKNHDLESFRHMLQFLPTEEAKKDLIFCNVSDESYGSARFTTRALIDKETFDSFHQILHVIRESRHGIICLNKPNDILHYILDRFLDPKDTSMSVHDTLIECLSHTNDTLNRVMQTCPRFVKEHNKALADYTIRTSNLCTVQYLNRMKRYNQHEYLATRCCEKVWAEYVVRTNAKWGFLLLTNTLWKNSSNRHCRRVLFHLLDQLRNNKQRLDICFQKGGNRFLDLVVWGSYNIFFALVYRYQFQCLGSQYHVLWMLEYLNTSRSIDRVINFPTGLLDAHQFEIVQHVYAHGTLEQFHILLEHVQITDPNISNFL